MERITITEALSEVNLIKKKVKAKQERVKSALFHVEHMPDPFESEGGSSQMISKEHQSMRDLQRRLQRIRAAISQANLDNMITVNDMTQSIHDWLIWKREIAAESNGFLQLITHQTKVHMDQAGKSPQVFKDEKEQLKVVKWIYHIDYSEWLRMYEKGNEALEKLDGQLSLKNATIVVEI